MYDNIQGIKRKIYIKQYKYKHTHQSLLKFKKIKNLVKVHLN